MSLGEDRLASALEKALKSPWAMYRNVAWLGKAAGALRSLGLAGATRIGV